MRSEAVDTAGRAVWERLQSFGNVFRADKKWRTILSMIIKVVLFRRMFLDKFVKGVIGW